MSQTNNTTTPICAKAYAPHHQPLRPVSCNLLNVSGIKSKDKTAPIWGTMIVTNRTVNCIHQYSDLRERPSN